MLDANNITILLQKWEGGDKQASEELFTLIYQELHRMARRRLRGESFDLTLQTTDLINEAYLRLASQKNARWANRAHFYGVAAECMRRVLIDYIKNKMRDKRGGNAKKISLDDSLHPDLLSIEQPAELIALDDALDHLEKLDKFQAEVVKQKFFGGFQIEEIAENTGTSVSTVNRAWKIAKLWLNREISRAA